MAAPFQEIRPQEQVQPSRPLSPHLTIYHWAPTMIVSITHRATGMALSFGMLVLAAWLVAISNGPDAYQAFYNLAGSPVGILALFGFAWSLGFHFLSGIRHLVWDVGYGFKPATARTASLVIIALSFAIAAGVFALVWTGRAGYLG